MSDLPHELRSLIDEARRAHEPDAARLESLHQRILARAHDAPDLAELDAPPPAPRRVGWRAILAGTAALIGLYVATLPAPRQAALPVPRAASATPRLAQDTRPPLAEQLARVTPSDNTPATPPSPSQGAQGEPNALAPRADAPLAAPAPVPRTAAETRAEAARVTSAPGSDSARETPMSRSDAARQASTSRSGAARETPGSASEARLRPAQRTQSEARVRTAPSAAPAKPPRGAGEAPTASAPAKPPRGAGEAPTPVAQVSRAEAPSRGPQDDALAAAQAEAAQATEREPDEAHVGSSEPVSIVERAGDTSATLQLEVKLIARAHRALADGDWGAAERALDAHQLAHPVGQLVAERTALRARARCLAGDLRGARALRAELTLLTRNSSLSRSLERACPQLAR